MLAGHEAFIYDRGGMNRIAKLRNIASVEWNRDRDATSEALVRVEGAACQEIRDTVLAKAATKRHELVIFRRGERVWEGPLTRIGDTGGSITFAAKDVTLYLFGRILSKSWDNRGTQVSTVTQRFRDILNYELTTSYTARRIGGGTMVIPAWESLSPPANILPHLRVHSFPNEARTTAYTQPRETTIGAHLAAYARSGGIDFTAVGRAIHIWDTSRSLGRTRKLTESDFFGHIITTEYGMDHTQIANVSSMNDTFGEAANPENMDFYGPWTTLYTQYNEDGTDIPSQVELDSQATRNTSGRSPAPREVRVPDNSSIRLSETLRITDLVAGVQVPLQATLNARAFSQLQKLDHVKVVEDASGERVQVTLSPATRPDDDVVMEG